MAAEYNETRLRSSCRLQSSVLVPQSTSEGPQKGHHMLKFGIFDGGLG